MMTNGMSFQEMADIWAHVVPKHQLKRLLDTSQDTGEKRHKGSFRDRRKGSNQDGQMDKVPQMMATMILRRKDSLKSLHQEMEYLIHLNPGQGSILTELLQASKDWSNQEEKNMPLRHCLASKMIEMLQTRFAQLAQSPPNSEFRLKAVKHQRLGLTWMAMRLGSTSEDWLDSGAYYDECTRASPLPLDVHQHFQLLISDWFKEEGDDTPSPQQHDAAEFASFLLLKLRPSFINMVWWPKWSLRGNPDQHDVNLDQERGVAYSPVTLPLPNQDAARFTLQQLISDWHDGEGHARVFTCLTRGAVIHLDRQREMIKDERPLQLDSIEISLPVSFDYNTPVVWIPFTICAIAYHQGRNVASGHFRTAVCQNVGGWRNYDDSQIPQHMVELPAFVLSRITLVWLIRKQLLTITDMVEVVDGTEPKP